MKSEVKTRFAHHKLDVWHAAKRLAVAGRGLAHTVPRGDRDLADQLKRAATAPVLLIGEGANRLNAGEKRQRFNEARAEACEAAVAAELAAELALVDAAAAREVVHIADDVAAMLTRLIQRFR